jgi:zinc protease
MRQKFSIVLFAAIIMLGCSAVFAQTQDVQPLPADPRVKTGTLANGLTYYIFKNDAVKGHADFAVAHKVGTSVEEQGQKGMARMLELLSIRGTRNFTDSTIVKYLNSIGVPNKNIVFNTNADDIVYGIAKEKPCQRQSSASLLPPRSVR